MKQYVIKKCSTAAIVLLSLPAFTFAQNEKDEQREKRERKEQVEKAEKDSRKDVQQIIITRKGDKDRKTVIEIKGDNILVNGKDASKMGDVTVNLNNLSDIRALQWKSSRDADHNFNFNFDNDDFGNGAVSLFNEDANRAMLGVTTDEDERGAKITAISRESAALKAGLKVGDVITKINNDAIEDADDVSKAVRTHKPGDKVTVSVLRDGKAQTITAELGKWRGIHINSLNATIAPMTPPSGYVPPAPMDGYKPFTYNYNGNGGAPKLGLSVQDTDDGKGVKVLKVADDSNAAKAGVKEGDVITHINDDEVNSTDEVVQTLRDARNEPNMTLKIRRDGKEQTIEVRVPRKLKSADL